MANNCKRCGKLAPFDCDLCESCEQIEAHDARAAMQAIDARHTAAELCANADKLDALADKLDALPADFAPCPAHSQAAHAHLAAELAGFDRWRAEQTPVAFAAWEGATADAEAWARATAANCADCRGICVCGHGPASHDNGGACWDCPLHNCGEFAPARRR